MTKSIEAKLAACPREDVEACVKELEACCAPKAAGAPGATPVSALPSWLIQFAPLLLEILKDFLSKKA